MVGRDPYGRGGGRQDDDREFRLPWDDEEPTAEGGAAEPEWPSRQPSRQPRSGGAPQSQRPNLPRRRQSPTPAPAPQEPWDVESEDGGSWPAADPYAQQPPRRQRPAPVRPPIDYAQEYADESAEELGDWRQQGGRGRSATGGRAERAPRAPRRELPRVSRPQVTMPPIISTALQAQDTRLYLVVAGAALSLAAMAALVATRVDALPAWFPVHLNAAGTADHFATRSALWRLPFGLAMLTIMDTAAALILGLRERYAAWLLIGTLPIVHLLAWIALILIAW